MNKKQVLEKLPIAMLIASINTSLDVLQKRCIPIYDWDVKNRELYRLKIFRGKIYFLAAEMNSKEKNK